MCAKLSTKMNNYLGKKSQQVTKALDIWDFSQNTFREVSSDSYIEMLSNSHLAFAEHLQHSTSPSHSQHSQGPVQCQM